MPINAGYEYTEAQKKLATAKTNDEKIKAWEGILSASPHHKGCEKLRLEIKQKISKLREKETKEKAKKGSAGKVFIKREGVAQVTILGVTNTGKSTLLNKLTNAKVKVAEYEYTTKIPESGIMDYKGIKIQIIEMPAIIENFKDTERGPTYLGIIKDSKAIILLYKTEKDKNLVLKELYKNNIDPPIIYYNNEDIEELKELIWKQLNLVYVYTKQPGKKHDYPPIALKKGSKIKDLAIYVHKDFLKNFKYARVWGTSVRFPGASAGLDHKFEDGDIIELHIK